MSHLPDPRLLLAALLFAFTVIPATMPATNAAEIRDRAVVRLRLDEASGNPADTATAGKAADAVTLPAAATSSTNVFIPGGEGRCLLLEPTSRQFISIDGKGDTSRPEAVTISGFFASLHPLTDGDFHGLFAKRNGNNGTPTNYGINFHPVSDNFQLYVHDGNGYKVANYSV
jgi:hypothetical protein